MAFFLFMRVITIVRFAVPQTFAALPSFDRVFTTVTDITDVFTPMVSMASKTLLEVPMNDFSFLIRK